jgi:hypothetical protein
MEGTKGLGRNRSLDGADSQLARPGRTQGVEDVDKPESINALEAAKALEAVK